MNTSFLRSLNLHELTQQENALFEELRKAHDDHRRAIEQDIAWVQKVQQEIRPEKRPDRRF